MGDVESQRVIVLAYVAVVGGPKTHDYCARFVGSYLANLPEAPHDLVIVCNGGMLQTETALLFDTLPVSPKFYVRKNDAGFDISGYIDVASYFPCDLLVACGETIFFHRPGWLKRYMEAWTECGPGMYGTFASFLVRPHLNTTGFCISPKFLRSCPRPENRKDRYSFEHGSNSIWKRVNNLGFAAKLVTWDGIYDPKDWRKPLNGLWAGDQSDCLMFCSHTTRYFEADAATRIRWQQGADGLRTTVW